MHWVGSNQQKKQPTSSPPGHVLALPLPLPLPLPPLPLPPLPLVPQSPGQFACVSGETHAPSPQTAVAVQSIAQLVAVSPVSHVPLPHIAPIDGPPQSVVHTPISRASQTPSPHCATAGASGVGSCCTSLPELAHAIHHDAAHDSPTTIARPLMR
jgi:hypothetical protein